jgi:hypothetical protein
MFKRNDSFFRFNTSYGLNLKTYNSNLAPLLIPCRFYQNSIEIESPRTMECSFPAPGAFSSSLSNLRAETSIPLYSGGDFWESRTPGIQIQDSSQ